MSQPPSLPACGASHLPPAPASGCLPERTPTFASTDLMQGHRTIAIEHQGITYRLQATRQGKLILTK